jgi:ribosomal protein S6
MMHNYEHTIITKQDLSETQTKKVISKYEDLIKLIQVKL